ncbi:Protein of unknown function [Gryllus bimaculatus]|nr:Protein of unknown function [Gryllus bimaculatus]
MVAHAAAWGLGRASWCGDARDFFGQMVAALGRRASGRLLRPRDTKVFVVAPPPPAAPAPGPALLLAPPLAISLQTLHRLRRLLRTALMKASRKVIH